METLEAIQRRRSIRKYHPEPVAPEALERILEAGRHAPSGANRQPWRFVIVEDATAKAEIRRHCEAADRRWHDHAPAWLRSFFDAQEITPTKEFLTSAPHLICVFAERGNPYWRESTWIAIGYMTLQATSEGLATLTYTPGQTRYLNRILSVPEEQVPICILPIGRAAEAPPPSLRPRRPLAESARRATSFGRVEAGDAAEERPADYGRGDGTSLSSVVDSREGFVALLELAGAAGALPSPARLGGAALPILSRLLRFDHASIDLAAGDVIERTERSTETHAPSVLEIPLAAGSRPQGTLRLRRDTGAPFTGAETEMAEAFGRVLALGLENAALRSSAGGAIPSDSFSARS